MSQFVQRAAQTGATHAYQLHPLGDFCDFFLMKMAILTPFGSYFARFMVIRKKAIAKIRKPVEKIYSN